MIPIKQLQVYFQNTQNTSHQKQYKSKLSRNLLKEFYRSSNFSNKNITHIQKIFYL